MLAKLTARKPIAIRRAEALRPSLTTQILRGKRAMADGPVP